MMFMDSHSSLSWMLSRIAISEERRLSRGAGREEFWTVDMAERIGFAPSCVKAAHCLIEKHPER
jgi:hypothetical protein